MSIKKQAKNPTQTRERILAYLGEHRTATVTALSRDWSLTRADIRYHLNVLIEKGQVELVPRDPGLVLQRGRPTQVYRLSAKAQPGNLPALCSAILGELFETIPKDQREVLLAKLSSRLLGPFSPVQPVIQRVNHAVGFLNQKGYRARWEAHANGPRLLLRSCPYAAILQAHPELCDLDRMMIEQLVQTSVQQVARMNLETGKPAACIFTWSPEVRSNEGK